MRKHARFELFEYAMIYTHEGADPIRSVIIDISLGGAQVRSRTSVTSGATVVIDVAQPDAVEPFLVNAEIRYSNAIPNTDLFAVGFRFTPQTAQEREKIARYVHEFFRLQGEYLLEERNA
ncbi:MAG: PilZ domain-containing protein [Chthonomonas sp.]|nr:PilZ domain-containing protein [Chthonomonas sp.]